MQIKQFIVKKERNARKFMKYYGNSSLEVTKGILKCRQNHLNVSSLKMGAMKMSFKIVVILFFGCLQPIIGDGPWVLIMYVSLNNKIFQYSALPIAVVLSLICCILNFVKLIA